MEFLSCFHPLLENAGVIDPRVQKYIIEKWGPAYDKAVKQMNEIKAQAELYLQQQANQ